MARRQATMSRIAEDAARLGYQGESPDRTVLANVDGNGTLLALQVDPEALRSAHPERVGPAVVAAIAAARTAAADEKERQVHASLDNERAG